MSTLLQEKVRFPRMNLNWLVGDESHAIVIEHGRTPGDDFGRRQVALPVLHEFE